MKFMVKALSALLAAAMCMGCAAYGSASGSAAAAGAPLTGGLFTDRDYETDYSGYVTVTLSDGASAAAGAGVTVQGDTVTITQAGTYLITGTLTDGQLAVDMPDDAKAQLVLANASVTCEGGAALYIKNGDKVFLTTAVGSDNLLRSTGEYVQTDENSVDGAIFSRCDLTMNGRGTLTVGSETGHGVVCKDDLKITGGTYDITAARDGLSANDSIRIADGDIAIQSGSDGMEASHDDADKGYVYIGGGTIDILCENDGIEASSTVTVEGGDISVLAGGGIENGPEHIDYWGMPDFGGFSSENEWEEAETDTTGSDSHKGVKAEDAIDISGGTLTLDTADDAIHSNGSVTVSGGTLDIQSGDDGVHADETLAVSDGTLGITAHEGLEALVVELSGGDIAIVSDDDGVNASGGSGASLLISGGTLRVNSNGDSLDANGTLLMTGGTVYITGPSGSGNGILDYDASGTITGGTLLATGVSGMQVNFGQSSTQGSILYTLPSAQKAGTTVTLTDSAGSTVAEYTAGEDYQVVLISTPDITAGQTYTLTAGTQTVQLEMTSLLYGAGGFGGGGFGGRGGRGGF